MYLLHVNNFLYSISTKKMNELGKITTFDELLGNWRKNKLENTQKKVKKTKIKTKKELFSEINSIDTGFDIHEEDEIDISTIDIDAI